MPDPDFNPADAFRDFYRAVAAVEPPEGSQLAKVLDTWQAAYNQVAPRGVCKYEHHIVGGPHIETERCIDWRAQLGPGKHRGDVVLYIDAHDTPRCATCSSTNVGAVDRGSEYYSISGTYSTTLDLKSQDVDMDLEFVCWDNEECPHMSLPAGYSVTYC